MADPLSIAASVTGLITIAGQIYKVVSKFVGSVDDAPESAKSVLNTVEEMRLVLTSVKSVMDQLSGAPRHRKEMIHVRHLVIIFRGAVTSFSELEAAVRLAGSPNNHGWIKLNSVKWVLEEENIKRALDGIEGHKTSLTLMLSTLQCESDIKAREDMKALNERVDRLFEQNQALLRIFEASDLYIGQDQRSIRFFNDDQLTIRPRPGSNAFGITPSTEFPGPLSSSTSHIETEGVIDRAPAVAAFRRPFEVTLDQTRVYRRVEFNQSNISFASSAVRSNAWSMLSDLSLNDISIISVIALPITLEDIGAIGPELTFAKIISIAGSSVGKTETPLQVLPDESTDPDYLLECTSATAASTGSTEVTSRTIKSYFGVDQYTIVMLGHQVAGKVSLAARLSFVPIFEDGFSTPAEIDGQSCDIKFINMAGQDENTTLREYILRSGEGFLLVYSVTSRSSFDGVQKLYTHLQRMRGFPDYHRGICPIVMVGNNCDCKKDERQVSEEEGIALAERMGCNFTEASSRNGLGVDQAFYDVVRAIRKTYDAPRTSEERLEAYRRTRGGNRSGNRPVCDPAESIYEEKFVHVTFG